MENTCLTAKETKKGTSAHIDECLHKYPGPIDVAKCLGKQWLKHPVKATAMIALGIGLLGLSTLYLPIKLLARKSGNKFIQDNLG